MIYESYYKTRELPPLPKSPLRNTKPQSSVAMLHLQPLIHIVETLNCTDMKTQLDTAIGALAMSWTEEHTKLMDTLYASEQEQAKLKQIIRQHHDHYEKAVRETRFYKNKYEKMADRYMCYRVAVDPSFDMKRYSSSLDTTTSTSSQDPKDSQVLRDHSLFNSNTSLPSLCNSHTCKMVCVEDSDEPVDLLSILSKSEIHTSELQQIKFKTTTSSTSSLTPPKPQPKPKSVLRYACGEGFWDTIAHSSHSKTEVDTLINNYLRRGGQPNVAKVYSTVRAVKEGYSLVHALVAVKNTNALERIIAAKANVNVLPLSSSPQDRMSPLVLAAGLGYTNGVRLLVEKGHADLINSRGPHQETALHAAVQCDSLENVLYLLRMSNNALLEVTDEAGATPLHYACSAGRTRMVSLFIRECGAVPNPKDKKGETPLHYAVRHRKPKVIAKIIGDMGLCPNLFASNGVLTPLDLARAGGLKAIARYLKEHGAKSNKEIDK
ncbi:ankyrin repeat-containing domain protein, partial [Spinellus fusiger]